MVSLFLQIIAEMHAKRYPYVKGGKGNGGCDCIGLIIGALEKMGIKWTGIHGTNYAIRMEMESVAPILDVTQLKPGDLVYKARTPEHQKYDLKDRYKPGGRYYNGDLKDYYHVGVVTEAYPKLKITHMTSPSSRIDTTLKSSGTAWGYFGKLKKLVDADAKETAKPENHTDIPAEPETKPVTEGPDSATVTAVKGKTVKMRQKPSTNCRLYDDVPVGTRIQVDEWGETWSKVTYGYRKGWYMMTKYLENG